MKMGFFSAPAAVVNGDRVKYGGKSLSNYVFVEEEMPPKRGNGEDLVGDGKRVRFGDKGSEDYDITESEEKDMVDCAEALEGSSDSDDDGTSTVVDVDVGDGLMIGQDVDYYR